MAPKKNASHQIVLCLVRVQRHGEPLQWGGYWWNFRHHGRWHFFLPSAHFLCTQFCAQKTDAFVFFLHHSTFTPLDGLISIENVCTICPLHFSNHNHCLLIRKRENSSIENVFKVSLSASFISIEHTVFHPQKCLCTIRICSLDRLFLAQ